MGDQRQTLRGMFAVLFCVMVLASLLALPALADDAATGDAATGDATTGGDVSTQAADSASADGDDDQAIGPVTAFFRQLAQAGSIGVILGLLSIVGVAFAIRQGFSLRRDRLVPKGLAAESDRLYRQGQFDQIMKRCKESDSTLGHVIEAIVDHRDCDTLTLRQIADDVGSADLKWHQQRNYPIAVVGTLAPLLGLLGTVIGMIGAFETVKLAGEMADPSQFGGDISLALITTALGLSVAIPALAIYHYFKTQTNQFGIELDRQVTELIRSWFLSAEAAAAAAQPATAASNPGGNVDGAAPGGADAPNAVSSDGKEGA